MKDFICAVALGVTACQASGVPLTMCAILADPKAHDGKEVTVSGSMVLAFEHASFGCAGPEAEKKSVRSVWISFDLPRIEKASPQFVTELNSDMNRANRWAGEARRDVVVKGRFRFSEEATRTAETPPFAGFGHLGSAPGEIVVTEVLQYGPNKTVDVGQRKRALGRLHSMQGFSSILLLACVAQAHAAQVLPAFESFAGKSVESEEVQKFISSRGDVEFSMTIACPVGTTTGYVFRDLGVVLECSTDRIVSYVRFYGDGYPGFSKFAGALPLGLTFAMTRREVETIAGRGKILSPRDAARLWIEYPSKKLIVVYHTSDRKDPGAKMEAIHLRAKP